MEVSRLAWPGEGSVQLFGRPSSLQETGEVSMCYQIALCMSHALSKGQSNPTTDYLIGCSSVLVLSQFNFLLPPFSMVKMNYRMYRSFYSKRIKATILFATETGRARNYANVVKDVFGRVFAAKVCCMEDYDKINLEHEQLLILVTSTFGSGDPPASGEVTRLPLPYLPCPTFPIPFP